MKSHSWKTLGLYQKQRHRNIVLEREITLIIKRIDMDCGVAERILCRCFEFVFSGGRIPTLKYKQVKHLSIVNSRDQRGRHHQAKKPLLIFHWNGPFTLLFMPMNFLKKNYGGGVKMKIYAMLLYGYILVQLHTHRCMRMA